MNLQMIQDFRMQEGVQMIRKRKIANYYRKEKGFTKKEAEKTANQTQGEFLKAQELYLGLFETSKPTFADRNDREKALKIYQIFNMVALLFWLLWLLVHGYLDGSNVTDNFILILLIISLAITSYLDEKIAAKIHLQKSNKLFKTELSALKQLAEVEETKRAIFRAEHRGIDLIEAKQSKENSPTEPQIKVILTKIRELKTKLTK